MTTKVKFVQISAVGEILYGVDTKGRIWRTDMQSGQQIWKLIPSPPEN